MCSSDLVQVQIVRVDMERRQIDLALEEVLQRVRGGSKRPAPTKSRVTFKKERRKGTPEERRGRKKRLGKNARKRMKSGK